jgi:hypothetical protein
MTDEIYTCVICTENYGSLRALKIHVSKKHNSNIDKQEKDKCKQSFCEHCGKVFNRKYNLDRHIERDACSKQPSIMSKIEEKIEEKIQTKIDKQPPQQITYITNNNNITNNNINNYGSRTYTNTQNNYLTNSNFDNLVPITNRRLQEGFQSVINEMKQTNQLIKSEKDLGFKLTSGPLKDSLVCTDASRGIVHWKDGDNDNQHIKDSGCVMLSDKMFNAISTKKEMLDDYKNYVYDKQDQCTDLFLASESISCVESAQFIGKLSEKNTFAKVGKSMSRTIPCIVSKKEYNLENLYKLIETMLYEKPYEVLLQNSEAFAGWFLKVLNRYDKFKIVKDNAIELNGEKEEVVVIPRQDIFLVLRQAFDRIEESSINSIVKCLLEVGLMPIVKSYIVSKEEALENFEILKKWLHEELEDQPNQTFERLFLRWYDMHIHECKK